MAFVEGAESFNVKDLIKTLESVGPKLEGREEDVSFVKNIIASCEFETLFKLHREVTAGPTKSSRPVTMNALELTHTISYELKRVSSPVAQELVLLLGKPHMDSLISTHDKIANKEFPEEFLSDTNENVEIVHLNKGSHPLGATIKSVDGDVVVARVLHGSVAYKSGLLHVGDVLVSINGHSLDNSSVDDVADEMQQLEGMVTFQLIRQSTSSTKSKDQSKLNQRMRARFSYDPISDTTLPCPEAGLGFCRGDILCILDQDDPEWWQAVKEGNSAKTGLIPSLLRQLRNEHTHHAKARSARKGGTLSNIRKKMKSQKAVYDATRIHDYGIEDVHPYEEVVKIAPQNNRPRPLILVAIHPIVQLQSIMDQLMSTNPNHFSLPRRQPHSLSREELVNTEDISCVITSGKTCLLSVPPQALRIYRTADIKPFVVFFKPSPASTPNVGNEERKLSREGAQVQEKYHHYFDQTLAYSDVQSAVRDVSKIARRLRRDFQWVPANWIHTATH